MWYAVELMVGMEGSFRKVKFISFKTCNCDVIQRVKIGVFIPIPRFEFLISLFLLYLLMLIFSSRPKVLSFSRFYLFELAKVDTKF